MAIGLGFRSTTELTTALRERKVGSLELLEHLVARAGRHNPQLNAIVAWDLEHARARARQADEDAARGKSWGPLHGLPITVKDAIEVRGMPTASGAPELKEHRPARHAPVAERAIGAGAIVFGKTNLPIYAGDFQTYNAVHGTTNTPGIRSVRRVAPAEVLRRLSRRASRASRSGATSAARSATRPIIVASTA